MIRLTLGVSDDVQALLDNIQSLGPALVRVSEDALDQAAAAILSNTRTNYLGEKAPDGTSWIPSAAGQARKAKGLGQTLFDTGNLFRSIQVYKEQGQRQIGTDVEYAPYQQYGKPPRVFLALTEEDVVRTERIFIQRIERMLNEQGL